MLGDLFFESGKLDQARRQYEMAAAPGATAKAETASRLSALERNQPSAADFASLRQKTGQDCVSCHGQ
jgi:hypothetical protein